MKKGVLFIILIIFEILAIIFLSKKIYDKSKNILGEATINPIAKDSIITQPLKDLKYFYEPKPNTVIDSSNWPYRGYYTINSDGLNERFEYPLKKSEKTYRIITLGDSFTYGLLVDTKDNWPEKLEDLLNNQLNCSNLDKFEVINLACQGYDIQFNVHRYKIRGQKYQPDLVIWFIVNELRITNKIMPLSKTIEDQLHKNKKLNKLDKYYSWNTAWELILNQYGTEKILAFQKENLIEFYKLYQGPLIFIYLDTIKNSHKNVFNEFLNQEYKKYWSYTITIPPDQKILNDGHPNEKGHQKIAENIYNFLIKNKIIPCQ